MKNNFRQIQILKTFQDDKDIILSKSEIKELSGISYHCNTNKHLGDCLSRMVKNGMLERVSKGKYKLGSGNKHINQPKNQTKLF